MTPMQEESLQREKSMHIAHSKGQREFLCSGISNMPDPVSKEPQKQGIVREAVKRSTMRTGRKLMNKLDGAEMHRLIRLTHTTGYWLYIIELLERRASTSQNHLGIFVLTRLMQRV